MFNRKEIVYFIVETPTLSLFSYNAYKGFLAD